MAPDFEIITKRLKLRILRQEDSREFAYRVSDSLSLHEWMDWCHDKFDPDAAQEFIRANRLNWVKGVSYGFGVFERERQQLVGMVALTEIHLISNSGSLGYWLADNYQRKGFASEATDALINFSFEKLYLTRLEIVCDPLNLASHKVATACGAINEGIGRNRFIYNGKPKDGLVFSVVPE